MRHYKEIEVPATARRVETHVTCNRCGRKIEGRGMYSADENSVEIVRGESYPEGGSGKRVDIDLCDSCAEALLAWIEKGGGSYEWKEYDW